MSSFVTRRMDTLYLHESNGLESLCTAWIRPNEAVFYRFESGFRYLRHYVPSRASYRRMVRLFGQYPIR